MGCPRPGSVDPLDVGAVTQRGGSTEVGGLEILILLAADNLINHGIRFEGRPA